MRYNNTLGILYTCIVNVTNILVIKKEDDFKKVL